MSKETYKVDKPIKKEGVKFTTQVTNIYSLFISIAMAMGGYILLTQTSVIYKGIAGVLLGEAARRLVVAHTKS